MTISDAFATDNFSNDANTSFTLPSPWYFRPEVYEKEKEEIFYKSWRFVCHRSDVSQPGDYVAVTIADQGVFVIRGRDGALRAFYNVCQHRAHELVSGKGSIRNVIRCPYHSWAYDLDGSLRVAPNCEALLDFDKSEISLPTIQVQELATFVFVNLDPKAMPIGAWAPNLEQEILKWLPDVDNVVTVEQEDFPVEANWKVVVENAIEGYHFSRSGTHHRELCQVIDTDRMKYVVHDRWVSIIAPPGPNKDRIYPFPASNDGIVHDDKGSYFVAFYMWPDWIVYSWPYASMISSFLVRPTGPESCVAENPYFHIPDRPNDETTQKAETWFNNCLSPEDIELNLGVQRGIRSRGYRQGRFIINPDDDAACDSEHCVHLFQKWVKNSVLDSS